MTAGPGAFAFASALSRTLGWIYTLCWSLSFYPQPIHNYRRRSTLGLAIDFPTANVLGFTSYTIFTAAFLFLPVIRSQYAFRNPTSPLPTVQYNDFAFALHGLVLCLVTYSQFWPAVWGFKVEPWQKASDPLLGICCGGVCGVLITALIVMADGKGYGNYLDGWAWIDVVRSLYPIPCPVACSRVVSMVALIATGISHNLNRRSDPTCAISRCFCDPVHISKKKVEVPDVRRWCHSILRVYSRFNRANNSHLCQRSTPLAI